MKAPRYLSDHCRGQLCTGLGRALDAGLDPVSALRAIGDVCDGALSAPLQRCANALAKGSPLARTLDRQGLISELDHALISVAENAGHLPQVFERLGERYVRAHARWRKMTGRMLVPAFTLLVAILALPVPALFSGRITPGRYLFSTLSMLALVGACVVLVRALVMRWRAHGPPTALTRTARVLPLLRRLSRLHERAEVSDALAMSLGAGIPASQALDNLLHGQFNGVRRENLVRARSLLDAGRPVADALEEAGLLDSSGGYAIVSAGEQSGRLEQSLTHYSRGANDSLDEIYDLLAQWVPIIAYAAVASVVAVGILG